MIISKRHKENLSGVDRTLDYDLKDAISLIKSLGAVKFDESVDLAVNLGVDPKHADQLVRGTVSLPNGTGKDIKVIVLTKDEDKIKEAKDSGAGKLGKVLGPKGLMPNPKAGTVTNEISKAINEIKAGKVEYRVDKFGIIHVSVGKLSFEENKLLENIQVCMGAIMKSKPTSLKGIYLKKVTLSSTMGPGLKINKMNFIG